MDTTTPTVESRQHNLKIWPEHFASLDSGERTCEIRNNDRNYRAGDRIVFEEWDPLRGEYTGRTIDRRVSYVFAGPFYSAGMTVIPPGYALLSLRPNTSATGTYTPQGPYDCLAKLAEGEPYFVLRGQDRIAPHLVSQWAKLAALEGCPAEKVKEAREVAMRMEAWPNRKYPD